MGRRAGRPHRARRPRRAGDPQRLRPVPALPGRQPGRWHRGAGEPADAPRRGRPRGGRCRRRRGGAGSRRARGCRAAGPGRPGGARRRRGALLHLGHDGPAQGRRAHPPRPPRGPHARGPRRSRAAAARRGGRGPPGRPHHGVRRAPRPGLQRCAGLRAGALPARRRARRPGAAARHDLRGRAGHVPPPPGGRRRGAGPVERAGVGLGGRRHARRPRRAVPAPRRHRQAALRRTGRQGRVLRGLRPGRVVGRGGGEGQPAPARPAAAGRQRRHPPARLPLQGRRRRRPGRCALVRSASCG